MFDLLYDYLIQTSYFEGDEIFLSYTLLSLKILLSTMFIWLPFIAWHFLRPQLIELKKRQSIKKMEFKLLEISIPKNIDKSPLAMEVALQALHQPFKNQNYYDQIFGGKVNSWFSLEIASTEGAVKFYIYTPKEFVKLVSAHLYSQYPTIEITEVEDYTTKVPFQRDDSEWDIFGTEFKLTKADPYPIKTYVDYGLNKLDLKEEYKVDPLTVMLEYLGGIGRNQHAWLQILVRAHESRYKGKPKPRDWPKFWKELYWKFDTKEFWAFLTNDWWTPPMQDWKKEAEKAIEDIKKKAGDKMSEAQKKEIQAMERSITKPGYDVGIRAVYIAKKESYDSANVAGLTGIMKQFSSIDLNSFDGNAKVTTKTDPTKDIGGKDLKQRKKSMFENYCKRAFFYYLLDRTMFVLNSEELATIYHFPGQVSSTPTFSRIESLKAEPPSNLPI